MTSAIVRVDGAQLVRNIESLARRVRPAALMLVVKDDAYGHGVDEVVRRAWSAGVRWIGAFDVPTALRVRAVLGPEARVFAWMLTGDDEIAAAIRARIDLGIGDLGLLEDVARVALDVGAPARIHLKIDSGLHRNGIRPEAWSDAVVRASELVARGAVRSEGLWSHIAESSDADDDRARAVFDAAVTTAIDAGLRVPIRHLAASAAATARPEFRYDLVRIGAFCYGIRPAGGPDDASLGIAPVAGLDATVVAVDTVSATICVGSWDGLPSPLAGLIDVRTPGGSRRLTGVGATSSTVEVWPDAAVGDTVRVFGPGASGPTDLAEAIDTIGEEIMLRVSPMLPRVWS